MKQIVLTMAMLLAMTACTNNKPMKADENDKDSGDVTVEAAENCPTYFQAIDLYLVNEIGKNYTEAEHCVPFHSIVDVDESNAEDILVYGDYWVFNYNQVGDTLKCVSGGNHPGLTHVRQTETGFEVTAFEQVEDGSNNLPSAKKIFGEKYDAFQAINSDEQKREKLRAEVLADYVKQHNLSVTLYQDFGWPAVKIDK